MKAIAIHSLQAILPTMLLSGILLSAQSEGKTGAQPPGTKGAPKGPNPRYAKDPPPTKKIVYKKVG